MHKLLRSFLLADAATVGAAVATPASAGGVYVPVSDFAFSESNGVYTIYDYDPRFYIWAFYITNPDAGLPGASAGTTQGTPGSWSAGICSLGSSCTLGADGFDYSNVDGASGLAVDLANDIGPGQESSHFTFSGSLGSTGYFQLVDSSGLTESVTGVWEIYPAVPEPSTWALMLAGFAGLGLRGLRRTKSRRSAIEGFVLENQAGHAIPR